jgi:hypothetical protein
MGSPRSLALFLLFFLALARPAASQAGPSYDLFLKSDYGSASVWIDTATGDFRWLDASARLDIRGRGRLEFPSLGPIVFVFSGPLKGYDWVTATLKIYGTSATGYLAAFPAGEKVRKVTSNFYDRNTQDDRPRPPKAARPPSPPRVGEVRSAPSEVPAPPPAP